MLNNLSKNLHKLFLLALVTAQAIAVVSVWGAVNPSLSVQFISPVANQQITVGDEIVIQAQISNSAYQLDTVHFVLTSESNITNQVSFQAYNTGSIWVADSSWDTTDYTPGNYYLFVRAISYDGNGNLIDFDQNNGITITLLATEDTSTPPEDQAEPTPTLPTVTIIQPTANATISGEQYQAQVQVVDLGTYQLRAALRRNGSDLVNSRLADLISGQTQYFTFNTTSITNGSVQMIFFVETSTTRQILAEVNLQISNTVSEPEQLPATPTAVITSPTANNLTITNDNYPLSLTLSRSLASTETLGVSLYQEQTERRVINLTNNNNNNYRGYLNTIALPDGRYQLIFWFNNGQRVVLHNSYYLNIDNPDNDQSPEFTINLLQPTEPITTESFTLRLEVNQPANNLSWNISHENDSAISTSGNMSRVGEGRSWSQNITLARTIFINGRYRLVVQATDSTGGNHTEDFYLNLNRANQNQPNPPVVPPENNDQEEDNQPEPEEPPRQSEQTPNSPVQPNLPQQPPVNPNTPPTSTPPEPEGEFINYLCQQRGITDRELCLRWLSLASDDIDPQCRQAEIYEALACEDYLNRLTVDRECQERNIIDRQACQDYLLEKYSSEVSCRLADSRTCQDILRNVYLNRLVVKQQRRDKMENIVKPLVGKAITTQQLSQTLTEGNLAEALPIKIKDKARVLLIQSQASTVLVDSNTLETTNSAVLALDDDGDSLPNDLEIYYQTDPANPDSDNDGYLDGEEISTNHNPLGEGALTTVRTDFDRVILSGLSLEQPRAITDRTDNNFVVVEPTSQAENIILSGKAEPNTWATIFIYSDLPLVMVAKTDASGNWSYAIGDALVDGEHRVYVTVNDDTGKIVKQSQPLSFLVRGAQAVTVDEYFSPTTGGDKVNNLILYYLLGAGGLILIALAILIYLHRGKDEIELNEEV